MSEEDEMLISEVARALNLSHVTVWRHIRAKKLPARKVGPIYLVKRRDFETFRDQERRAGRPRKDGQPPETAGYRYPLAGDVATYHIAAER